MTKDGFKHKSNKELENTIKILKTLVILLSVVIFLLISTAVYGLLCKENNPTFIALIVIGISCAAVLPLQFVSIKKMKDELKSREK